MPGVEAMTATVHAYVAAYEAADEESVVILFAEDAVIEDPVGTPPKRGHEEIRAFFRGAMEMGCKPVLDGPICLTEDHAAFPMRVPMCIDGQDMVYYGIDVFAFDAEGKVREMRAYHGPSNLVAKL
ncbi:nuclear transport factor 2 family protein [Novosphingobium sp. ES2-1]|uniref:nuclear transport factor 2 family protein n=1 Tax=Novosphingobium sp. ES2-1 TaxID=2780074 RepID=UPI00188288E5|nr:nuclear transport factor 2 family protein [Novosphingobium sp. ES2-1]QOV96430.1 nuclear transport factor 2 family protein [Novosphingobium sp. ES2-1]